MTKDKWFNIIDMVDGKFGIDKEYKEPISPEIPGENHIIEFKSPMGKVKLEFTEKPRVVDEKTTYSNRVGSHVKVEKIYHDEEKVCYLNAFKWDDAAEEWQEVDSNLFNQ